MHEEEKSIAEPLTDRAIRAVIILFLLAGGTFFALEFTHWLANGGLTPFLIGSGFCLLIFCGLVLWSRLLSFGFKGLHSRTSILSLGGLLVAISLIVGHLKWPF